MGCFQAKTGLPTFDSCRITASAVPVLLMETHFLTLFISKLTVHLALAGNIYQSPLISSFPAFYHVPFGFTLAGDTFTLFLGGDRSILLSYGTGGMGLRHKKILPQKGKDSNCNKQQIEIIHGADEVDTVAYYPDVAVFVRAARIPFMNSVCFGFFSRMWSARAARIISLKVTRQ